MISEPTQKSFPGRKRPMAKFNSEADVKKEIKKRLMAKGWKVWAIPANGYGSSGISDQHALKDGVFLAIEAKFRGNKPTKLQSEFLTDVAMHGGSAFVVDEATVDQFIQFVDTINAFNPPAYAVITFTS